MQHHACAAENCSKRKVDIDQRRHDELELMYTEAQHLHVFMSSRAQLQICIDATFMINEDEGTLSCFQLNK